MIFPEGSNEMGTLTSGWSQTQAVSRLLQRNAIITSDQTWDESICCFFI